jgi:hypothetical protein
VREGGLSSVSGEEARAPEKEFKKKQPGGSGSMLDGCDGRIGVADGSGFGEPTGVRRVGLESSKSYRYDAVYTPRQVGVLKK